MQGEDSMAKINIEKNIVFYGEKNEWKGAHIAARVFDTLFAP